MGGPWHELRSLLPGSLLAGGVATSHGMEEDVPTGTLLRAGQENGQRLDVRQPWRINGI